MAAELQARPQRNKSRRRQKKLIETARIAPCGRPASSTQPFFSIQFPDGTEFIQSAAALERCGFCPDCVADHLVEQGFLRYGRPMVAVGGEGEIDLPGALNGSKLVYILTRLSLRNAHPLSFVQDAGWC
jgi:hypothetical protein